MAPFHAHLEHRAEHVNVPSALNVLDQAVQRHESAAAAHARGAMDNGGLVDGRRGQFAAEETGKVDNARGVVRDAKVGPSLIRIGWG